MKFADLGLDHRLVKRLATQNFAEATPVQQQTIPYAITGNDVLVSSATGSGKTLAYLLPAFHQVLRNRALTKNDPRVLILTPTRELAYQVYQQVKLYTGVNNSRAILLVGGENFNDQYKALKQHAQFIVGTPGRVADHLSHRSLYLQGLEMLILDEADRMMDLGFADALQAINKAADHRKRQTLLFSATLEHTAVTQFGKVALRTPRRIAIGDERDLHQDIEQTVFFADHLDHKQALLQHFLNLPDLRRAIVFTATKSDTSRLAELFNQSGVRSIALHGDIAQTKRSLLMQDFSRGLAKVLFTTDVASRGLDVSQVSHVINFDLPKHPEEYIHRIGRTGRAGAKGFAYSLVSAKDWASYQAIKAMLNEPILEAAIPGLAAKFNGIVERQPRESRKVATGTNKPKKQNSASPTKAEAPVKRKPAISRPKKPVGLATDNALFNHGHMPIKKKPKPIADLQGDDDNSELD